MAWRVIFTQARTTNKQNSDRRPKTGSRSIFFSAAAAAGRATATASVSIVASANSNLSTSDDPPSPRRAWDRRIKLSESMPRSETRAAPLLALMPVTRRTASMTASTDDTDAAIPPPVSPPCFAMPSLSARPTRSGLPVGPLISDVMYQTCCGRLAAVR